MILLIRIDIGNSGKINLYLFEDSGTFLQANLCCVQSTNLCDFLLVLIFIPYFRRFPSILIKSVFF